MSMLKITRTYIKMAIKAHKKENNTIDVLENFSQQLMRYAAMIDEFNRFKLNILNRSQGQHVFCIQCGETPRHDYFTGWNSLKREIEEEEAQKDTNVPLSEKTVTKQDDGSLKNGN